MFAGAALAWSASGTNKKSIADALNRIVFQDDTGRLGHILTTLGNVYKQIPKRTHNKTLFDMLLFSRNPSDIILDLPLADLASCVEQITDLSLQLRGSRPRCSDGVLVREEIAAGARMALMGLWRGIRAAEGKVGRTRMRHTMQSIIDTHKRIWLERNRPGGLTESAARLHNVLKIL